MWFLLSSNYMLYFLVFLFFCDDFTNWEYCCESVIIYSVDGNPPVPFNRSLPLHELWCIYPNNVFFEDCGQWVSSCSKTQLHLSFLCTYIHLQAMQNPGKLIGEEGHQFHVSADTCTCKPVVKQISSQDHTGFQGPRSSMGISGRLTRDFHILWICEYVRKAVIHKLFMVPYI